MQTLAWGSADMLTRFPDKPNTPLNSINRTVLATIRGDKPDDLSRPAPLYESCISSGRHLINTHLILRPTHFYPRPLMSVN